MKTRRRQQQQIQQIHRDDGKPNDADDDDEFIISIIKTCIIRFSFVLASKFEEQNTILIRKTKWN